MKSEDEWRTHDQAKLPKMAGMKSPFEGNEREETHRVLKQQDSATELNSYE